MRLKLLVESLKVHELFCYQIAYFILEREEEAVLATKKALLELGGSYNFLSASAEEQWQTAKQVVMRHSLKVKGRK